MNTHQISIEFNQNSLYNWENIILPELTDRQREYLNALRYLGRATNAEIATHLKVFPHVVSGRQGELLKKGLIKQVDQKKIGRSYHAIMEVVM